MIVSEKLLRGIYNNGDIANELGVSRSTISRDVMVIEQKWHEEMIEKYDRYKAVKLRELDELKLEAWEAWERSKDKYHKIVSKAKGIDPTDDKGREITTTVEERIGEPKFLQIIRDCIDKQAELAGLKVHKIAPTDPEGKESYGVHLMEKIIMLAEEVGEGADIIDVEYVKLLADETQAAMDGKANKTRTIQDEE